VPADRLSAAKARRIALAAQGFATPRPAGAVGTRQLRRAIEQVAILQLDSVNVFARSHYLPLFSRLGGYPRQTLDALTAHKEGKVSRGMFEYWGHMASLMPVEFEPLLRFRMARAIDEAWGGMVSIARERPELLADVRELVRSSGPIRSSDTGVPRPVRSPGQMWNWHDGKRALEYLFWSGEITSERRVNFERRYDLRGRVFPPEILATPTPDPVDAQRELVRISARAMGVATEPDLGDYFRLSRAESKARVAELVEGGELLPVAVEGWNAPAYLWPGAKEPRAINARALLSPFDSLIWFRERTLRLFDFHYRIEIYTPQPKRVYGYYVLPFLLGERLVARVDLKSDRQSDSLRVRGAFVEPGADKAVVAHELAAELVLTSEWLGLGRVIVEPNGDLAIELARAVAGTAGRAGLG
jgi:uncharacterized protein YcaQ